MLLDLLMKYQLVDAIILNSLPDIKEWNEERTEGNLVFDIDLETAMLNEEYFEFLNAKSQVDRLDALLDYGFVLAGTISKFLHNPELSQETFEFLDEYFGKFVDLYIIFTKYITRDHPKINPQDIPIFVANAMPAVIAANNRKGIEKNEEGKIIKPKDFVGPEKELQVLLDTLNVTK